MPDDAADTARRHDCSSWQTDQLMTLSLKNSTLDTIAVDDRLTNWRH